MYTAKNFRDHLLLVLTLLGLFLNSLLSAQSQYQYLQNPSIESLPQTSSGQDDVNLVDAWDINPKDTWSNPNFYMSRTYGQTTYKPVDGKYFALFRARGVHYDTINGWGFPPLTREYLFQELLKPLEANSCFEFKVNLCYNPHYPAPDLVYPDTAFPVKFQIWGGFGPDERTQLLGETAPITNTKWKPFTFHFVTGNRAIPYILIQPQWDTVHVYPEPYCGFMMVDSLSLTYAGKPNTVLEHNALYRKNDSTVLTPDNNGVSYHWYPEGVVSDPTTRSPILTQYTDSVEVIIQQSNGCPVIEVFHIKLDCASLYPDNQFDTVFYYKFEKGLQLHARNGVSWQWEPPTNLSSDTIQSPTLTDYHDYYQVYIQDKYGCKFVQNYHIIWNCDTLYPNGELTVLNDTLTQPKNIPLNTFVGKPVSNWSPPNYLSCTSCESPVASPQRSITYSIKMKDNYSCIHIEKFIFTVPLKVPNVITPNGDGYNDCLKVFGLPENTTFYLFDKSGRTICAIHNFENVNCWDGSQENLRSGTYWYAFTSPNGTLAKGFILIIR